MKNKEELKKSFLKEMGLLYTELHKADGFACVVTINEIEAAYDKHVIELETSTQVDRLPSEVIEILEESIKDENIFTSDLQNVRFLIFKIKKAIFTLKSSSFVRKSSFFF